MSFVVTENCINCKHTDCVQLCPTEAFHESPNFVVINPDECIDCALCVSACPVDAIFDEADLPPDQREFAAINARLALQWPVISEQRAPLDEADYWRDQPGKRQYLELPLLAGSAA